jgi:hypothetical protein
MTKPRNNVRVLNYEQIIEELENYVKEKYGLVDRFEAYEWVQDELIDDPNITLKAILLEEDDLLHEDPRSR